MKGRIVVVLVVAAFLVGATIAGGISWYFQGAQRADLIALFQKVLQPLGTTIVAGLYFCRDFLAKNRGINAVSDSIAQATASPSQNIQNIQQIYLPSATPPPTISRDEIDRAIHAWIENKGVLNIGVLTARALVVVDGEDRERIILGVDKMRQPYMTCFDDKGEGTATLTHSEKSEPTLCLFGKKSSAAVLGLKQNTPIMSLVGANEGDQENGPGIVARVREDQSSGIALFNKSGKLSVLLHDSALLINKTKTKVYS